MPESHPPRRRISRLTKLLILTLVGLYIARAAWIGFKHFGLEIPIEVSRANTFITSPIDEAGLPDYHEYLLQTQRQGVSAQDNAVVLLSQVIGLRLLSPQHRKDFFAQLGVQPPKGRMQWFLPLDQSLKSIASKARRAPWPAEAAPELSQWLNKNQYTLDLAVRASKLPHYFTPLIGDKQEEDGKPLLVSIFLPVQQETQYLANALCLRATQKLQANDLTGSLDDILAAARLARLLSNRSFLVCHRLACECEEAAMEAMQSLLASKQLKAADARSILRKLESLPNLGRVTSALNPSDRIMALDILMNVKRYGINVIGESDSSSWDWLDLVRIDYNVALSDFNSWFDRLDEAAAEKNREIRRAAWTAITADLLKISNRAAVEKETREARMDLQRRSQTVSDILVSLLLPDVETSLNLQDRTDTLLELTRLTAALAVYRAEQGEYPEQLADLVPTVLEKLPLDLYSGKPFIYQRKDDGGYLLYSVFENGTDDGGTDLAGEIIKGEWVDQQPDDFDYSESDLAIRVPLPKFKFPPPPKPEEYGFEYGAEFDGGFADETEDETPETEAEPQPIN